jgi:hypothetical protein
MEIHIWKWYPKFSTAVLENSCGKKGAVKTGRKNHEGGFRSRPRKIGKP